IQNSAAAARNAGTDEFLKRCPDYPNTPQSAAIMNQHFQNQPAQYHALPVADRLELAFNDLTRRGMIVPVDVPIEGNAGDTTPLPRVGSGTQLPAVDFERQFRALTSDQQAKVINELYSKGAR